MRASLGVLLCRPRVALGSCTFWCLRVGGRSSDIIHNQEAGWQGQHRLALGRAAWSTGAACAPGRTPYFGAPGTLQGPPHPAAPNFGVGGFVRTDLRSEWPHGHCCQL